MKPCKDYIDSIVTTEYLKENPTHIFVYGDNMLGWGKKGAAIHRDEPNTFGFVTKKRPSYSLDAYFKPMEYKDVFDKELSRLMRRIEANPEQTFLISRLGSGLADRYLIWEKVIHDGLKILQKYDNVRFLFDFDNEI
jgi:hypothetical protein